jgi:CMP/dCMP kinase
MICRARTMEVHRRHHFRRRVPPQEEESIMNADVAPEGRKGRIRTVTISREYGSGGGEIASRLARRLGWDLVDHAIVERTACTLGTTLADAEAHDESVSGILARVLESMRNLDPAYMAMAGAPPGGFLLTEDYRQTAEEIVRAAAERGLVVIVGRASSVLLAGRWDVMHVRVVAPFAERVAYVMRREGLDRHAAEVRIHHKDHERASYLEREYHHRPDESYLYDIVLNTSRLDLESAVNVIMFTVHEIDVGLPTKTAESGPATGLARYPTPPGDFHPTAS